MTQTAEVISETLQLKHHYQASPEQVFSAWKNAEVIGQWFGPQSHQCKVEKYDFTKNGEYQIRMIPLSDDHNCSGDKNEDSVCAGQFVEIEQNKKIIMTFNWIEGGADMGDTLLSIELATKDNGTELVLTHERLPNQDLREAHEEGWSSTLECLDTFLSK